MFNFRKFFGPNSCKQRVRDLLIENKNKSEHIVSLIDHNKDKLVLSMVTPNEQLRKKSAVI
jgi:hypothetical protein